MKKQLEIEIRESLPKGTIKMCVNAKGIDHSTLMRMISDSIKESEKEKEIVYDTEPKAYKLVIGVDAKSPASTCKAIKDTLNVSLKEAKGIYDSSRESGAIIFIEKSTAEELEKVLKDLDLYLTLEEISPDPFLTECNA